MSLHSVRDLFSRARNINPGAWAVEYQQPLSTLLGSCVAVCFYDRQLRLGGMNHFLLPSRLGSRHEQADIVLAGDASMETLLNAMLAKGARKERLSAKVFGGGTIISSIRMAIGERNVAFAEEWLEREGIPVTAADTLGNFSRKLLFDPVSGDAYCRRSPVDKAGALRLAQEESAYEQRLQKPLASRERIELF